jgi:hypothetical protein
MNREFKLRYDQMREGDPAKTEETAQPNTDSGLYHAPGHARNLCLVWPDGKRFFLNYAYLIAGELNLDGEKNVILLHFSSHTVTLAGYGLGALFRELLDHLPRIIFAVDERYIMADDSGIKEMAVVEITVESKEVKT